MFQQFLNCVTYSRSFALSLIDVAQGRRGDSWEVRRLATLMLQEHLLSLPASNSPEFKIIFQHLGLEVAKRRECAEAGYSRRGIPAEIFPDSSGSFGGRLARPRCAVRPRGLKRITRENVREFALQSRQECKLVLARYMFPPEEVIVRVHRQIKRSAGIDVACHDEVLQKETDRLIGELPDYEAAILRQHAISAHGLLGGG